ncbi:hypothetical protein EDD70_0916 [Hydrogenoanaerobacterium saccharovorans]|uniref:Cu+-exporting ATPase n=1 Tax=Hydrogenoanaerobacterium saccharovorans TaxID=474960 RepID=A0A1H8AA91_9FIRM|nr:cation-translocating P-type ATPase [Hydrogenoanaerobacterium saccharovorans]RPF48104.1 hypothetical protein EDD70_0916 [Hydrogenoanaerobacterium saccharovorans]SEM66718.1 hypothetical protein SAMN05216180_1175 [Hydrogenoanaerobacterium saccharovorans]
MNRNYDIDSILAEIKNKKSGRAPSTPQRTAYAREERDDNTYDEQYSARHSSSRAQRGDYEDDYAQERPVRRPAPRRGEEYEEYYEEERPVRRSAPRRAEEYEDYYEQERPVRRPAVPHRAEEYDNYYEEQRPVRRPVTRRPVEYEGYYEEERPVRRSAPSRVDYDERYEEDYRRPAPPQIQQYDEKYEQNPSVGKRIMHRSREEEIYEPASAIYAVAGEDMEDDPPTAQPHPQERTVPYSNKASRKEIENDDFMMKYSGLSSIGSGTRKTFRTDRESIRSNFGSAAEPPAKSTRIKAPKKSPTAPEESVPVPKPELKGGFRFNPSADFSVQENDEASGEFTRLDLPISNSDDRFTGSDFDNTRSLPTGLNLKEQDSDVIGNGAPVIDGDIPEPQDESSARMELEEYNSPSEAAEVKADLDTLRSNLLMRFIMTIVCSIGLLYLGLSQTLPVPVPEMISATGAPAVFVIVNMVLLIAATLACHSTISNGVVGLFTLKANNDSLAALAVLASVMQGVSLILNPSSLADSNIHLYFSVSAIGLMFNTVGKMFTVGRITGNFRFISSSVAKYTVQTLNKRELGREFTWDMNIDEPHISYSTPTDFAEEFIRQSYADDTTDNIAKITVPIIFAGSVVVAVMSYIFNKDMFIALSTFAAILAIASPITATIVGSLPLHKAYRSLSEFGAVLSGYNAVERFSDTNVILADACELFTNDEVLLHNIKTFEKNRIDEAILDASSVLCMCNGAVKNIFLRIIQGNTKMLKPVENLVYEDAMGISGWVGGKRVLIGNSELMKHHGIDTPSKDYEAKYRTEDRDILYLANSGELTAMFVISYVRNEEVDVALGDLERKGISVVVKSVDPNLTAAKIARIYDLPEEMIRILPAKLHSSFDAIHHEKSSNKGYIVHSGNFAGFAIAVSAASSVKIATNIGLIVQIVGMILGYTLITFFSFMGSMAQATMVTVLIYQAVWGVAVWLFSALRRI